MALFCPRGRGELLICKEYTGIRGIAPHAVLAVCTAIGRPHLLPRTGACNCRRHTRTPGAREILWPVHAPLAALDGYMCACTA